MKGHWTVYVPHRGWEWEQDVLDRNGKPLIVREPRPVGFRPPRA